MSLKSGADPADGKWVTADREAPQQAVEELVAHYQAKARQVGRLGVAIGAGVGVLVGSIPLSPLRFAWPIPSSFGFATILGGLAVGVLIGYVIGDGRSKMYERMADQARLQLQLEERISQNDKRMAQLLTALTARAAAARQAAPPPAPQPQAVKLPQPVQAAPPVPQYAKPLIRQPAPPVSPAPAPPAAAPHLTEVPPVAPPAQQPAAGSRVRAAPGLPPLSPPVSGSAS